MGNACSSQKKTRKQIKMSMSSILQVVPAQDSYPRIKVLFFDSQELCYHLRSHPKCSSDTIRMLINNMDMNSQRDACLEEVKQLLASKNEVLLRSFNQYTDQSMKLVQKLQEYYNNYFLQYQQTNHDIPLIKQIISEMTLQLCIESLLIVNTLVDKNFKLEEKWWSDEYFQSRIQMIEQSYYQQEPAPNSPRLSQVKFDETEQLIQPFLNFLISLKNRIRSSVSVKQQMAISLNGSTQIIQHQNTLFYQSILNQLAFSVDPNELTTQNKNNVAISNVANNLQI